MSDTQLRISVLLQELKEHSLILLHLIRNSYVVYRLKQVQIITDPIMMSTAIHNILLVSLTDNEIDTIEKGLTREFYFQMGKRYLKISKNISMFCFRKYKLKS